MATIPFDDLLEDASPLRTIRSKPGVYGGKMMRSRLEIAWAKFWDERGGLWEYEPEQYRTRTWQPDFVLFWYPPNGKLEVATLVEVKPSEDVFHDEGGWDKYWHPDHTVVAVCGYPGAHTWLSPVRAA